MASSPGTEFRDASSLIGSTGLLRVSAADGASTGTLRLSFALDFFRVSSFFVDDDDYSRIGGTLAISGALTPWMEAWFSTRARSHHSDRAQPSLLQSQGDLTFGLKVHHPILERLSLGAMAQATLLSGIGTSSFDLGATEAALHGLVTSNLSSLIGALPLRTHLQVGVLFDNSESLLVAPLSNAERFAFAIGDYNRFQIGVGLELPFSNVTPYIEYGLDIPLGYLATPGVVLASSALRPAQTAATVPRACTLDDETSCARPAASRAFPQRLTLGARLTALRDLTLDAAFDIGLTPEVATGVPATPPWGFLFLLGYAFDPFHDRVDAGPPISVPVLIPDSGEYARSVRGRLLGSVRSQGREVAGAIVSFDRALPVASSPSGAFRSHELEPGPVMVTVTRDGFEPQTARAEIVAGSEAQIAFDLRPIGRATPLVAATIRGKVVEANGKPVPGVLVSIRGSGAGEVRTNAEGAFALESGPGPVWIAVEGEGWLSRAKRVEVRPGEDAPPTITLRRRPKAPLAEVVGQAIVVRQNVPFAANDAKVGPEAQAVLDSVADILAQRSDIRRLRIEAHTDNAGAAADNLALSKSRANAILEYLVEQGVEPTRLEAQGFGAERPIAPNLTRRGREQNRRVEFPIAEQE